MSVFWAGMLGSAEDPLTNDPDDEACMISSVDGAQRLLYIEVPDTKQVTNRLHLTERVPGHQAR